MPHFLFVHGISIRERDYQVYLDQIRIGLSKALPTSTLSGCLWGDLYGARLRSNGDSIPDYDRTKDVLGDDASSDASVWRALLEDPYFELRLLTLIEPGELQTFDPRDPATQAETLDQAIRAALPSDSIRQQATECGISDESLLDSLRRVPQRLEYSSSSDAARHDPATFATVWARAVVAASIHHYSLYCDHTRLNALAIQLAGSVYPQPKGVVSNWIKSAAMTVVTSRLTNRRGLYSDLVIPYIGDILVYQGNGREIRSMIGDSLSKLSEQSVVLLGHSLGGIACVDLLNEMKCVNVAMLITVGSQASLLYELDSLQTLRFGSPLNSDFPPWLNIYDSADFLSYLAKPVFKDARITDKQVANGRNFPASHGAYFSNPNMWRLISEYVAELDK